MRRNPDAPDQPASPVQPAFIYNGSARRAPLDDTLGLDCLARTMGQAARNVSLVSLNSMEQAALKSDRREAADAARGLAEQMTSQLRSLELALAEVLPPRR